MNRAVTSGVWGRGLALACVLAGAHAARAAGAAGFVAGSESALAAPQGGTMRVYMPSNYVAEQKWPAVFYYGGAGGSPDIALMRTFADGRDYIVVGMPYLEEDVPSRTPQEQDAYLRRELAAFRAARAWIEGKVSVDDSRVFIGGASKGGWIASALGEMDIGRLGGMIILLAGRRQSPTAPAPVGLGGKAIYVGAGEKDANMMPARRAVEVYKRCGAVVTYEEFAGSEHEIPADAPRLRAWLAVRGRYRQSPDGQAARQEVTALANAALTAAAAEHDDLAKYDRLLDLARDPRLRFCDPATVQRSQSEFAVLQNRSPCGEEWAAEMMFDEAVYREASIRHVADMKNALDEYQKLVQMYPQTRYGKLAALYAPKLAEAYTKSVEATHLASASQPGAGSTNGAHGVAPNFGGLGAGGPAYPMPVWNGNHVTFGPPPVKK